jgi:predicted phage tail protein
VFHRHRFVLEVSAALLCAAIFVLTLVEPAWFERMFGASPDGGDGSLEALIALGASFVAGGICARLAWREWLRRPADSPADAR